MDNLDQAIHMYRKGKTCDKEELINKLIEFYEKVKGFVLEQ